MSNLKNFSLNGITHVRPGNGWKPHRNLHIFGKIEGEFMSKFENCF